MLDQIVLADLTIGPVALLLLGAALLLWGRKLFMVVVACAGFMIGYMYGGPLAAAITDSPDVIRWAPLALGILVAIISGLLLKLSFFLAGLVLGWFICVELAPESELFIRVVIALLSGGLLLACRRVLIVVLTSLVGARMFTLGAISILASLSFYVSPLVATLLNGFLAIGGIVLQLRRKERSR